MRNRQEDETASRDFWQDTARYDKNQIINSLGIAAGGVAMTGAGIVGILTGQASGLAGIGIGLPTAIFGAKMAFGEIDDYADATAKAALRQDTLDRIAEALPEVGITEA